MSGEQWNVMTILKHLNKSNCHECGSPTCIAFAALVVQGRHKLQDCPHLSQDVIRSMGASPAKKKDEAEARRDNLLEQRREEMGQVNFAQAAQRLGAAVKGDRLAIPVLGKNFELDKRGNLHSECHVNAWVHQPLLNYVIMSAGRDLLQEWVPFRELKKAKDWHRFFSWRCEKGIKEIVDLDPDFFFDAMSLFSASPGGGKSGEAFSNADYVVVLYPLPKVPLMIAYWRSEDEFESTLTLFFDRSAEVNLGAENIYLLTMGIVEMFRRIFSTHGADNI